VLAARGVEYELLDGRTAASRWPVAFEPDEPVLFQADGGTLRADRAIGGLLGGARAAGGHIVEQTPVTAIRHENTHVAVETTCGKLTTNAVVVAAGAWSRGLLEPLGIELETTPTRETVSYFELDDADELPTVIDYTLIPERHDRVDLATYSLCAPGVGLKVGLHRGGPTTDPNQPGEIDERTVAWEATWVARRIPRADPQPLASEACIYTNTPDQAFVIERHGPVIVASACSGHGFKFAPALGETIAALVGEALG
jgi:sarcosine oxidase